MMNSTKYKHNTVNCMIWTIIDWNFGKTCTPTSGKKSTNAGHDELH